MRHRKGIEPDGRGYVVRLGEVKVGKLELQMHYVRKKTSIFNKRKNILFCNHQILQIVVLGPII